jgi:hypothetical protein
MLNDGASASVECRVHVLVVGVQNQMGVSLEQRFGSASSRK